MNGPKVGYMCRIAWDLEVENKASGNTIYPSIESLRQGHVCADTCGIVKVVMRLEEVVVETADDY